MNRPSIKLSLLLSALVYQVECFSPQSLCKKSTQNEIENDRREFVHTLLKSVSLATTILSSPSIVHAEEENSKQQQLPNKTFVKGSVILKDVELPQDSSDEIASAALYITARPNKADNVPRAILDGSNGKPPPVLAARIPRPVFPLDFSLTSLDLTQEGASLISGAENDIFWFEGMDLIVSARFDTDGVAYTRDPSDLVGRCILNAKQSDAGVTVPLTGRGFTGKMVTGKSKK